MTGPSQSSPMNASALADEIDLNRKIGADHRFSDAEAQVIQDALRAVPVTPATPALGDVGDLADEIDAALNDYLTNAGDALGSRLRRMKLEETLWDNKAGIVAYLRAAARSSADSATWPHRIASLNADVAELEARLAEAVEVERERCAKIANDLFAGTLTSNIGKLIGEAIRRPVE